MPLPWLTGTSVLAGAGSGARCRSPGTSPPACPPTWRGSAGRRAPAAGNIFVTQQIFSTNNYTCSGWQLHCRSRTASQSPAAVCWRKVVVQLCVTRSWSWSSSQISCVGDSHSIHSTIIISGWLVLVLTR